MGPVFRKDCPGSKNRLQSGTDSWEHDDNIVWLDINGLKGEQTKNGKA